MHYVIIDVIVNRQVTTMMTTHDNDYSKSNNYDYLTNEV